MEITEDFIRRNITDGCGILNSQLKLLGETRTKGWLRRLIGKTITQEQADEFVRLGHEHRKENNIPDTIIDMNEKSTSIKHKWDALFFKLIREKGSAYVEAVIKDIESLE